MTTNEDTAKAITLSGSDPDGADTPLTYTIVDSPAHGVLSGTGSNRTYTPAANFNGSDSFTFRVSDGELDSGIATVSIEVMAVNDAPTATNNLVSQSVQYSDPIQIVTVTGMDVETPGPALTAIPEFSTDNGSSWQPGVPSGLTFSSNNNGTWIVSGVASVSAGSYPIRVMVTDADQSSASTTFTIGVNKETTATDYTGDFDLMTAGPAINTATVRLAAQLTQDADNSLGDLMKATVTFKIFKFNATAASFTIPNIPVDVNGEAETTYSLPADVYAIRVEIGGSNQYWNADPINDGMLNITVPTNELRSSGGGWIPDTASASGKSHLAFSVTASKNGQPKGNVSFSYKGTDGFKYLVKSNSWQNGYLQFSTEAGVTPTVYTRSNLKGNCTVQKIDPATGAVVASFGGYTFEIFTRDGDLLNPRQSDSYSITVRSNTNTVFYQAGEQYSLITLGGGNITNKAK